MFPLIREHEFKLPCFQFFALRPRSWDKQNQANDLPGLAGVTMQPGCFRVTGRRRLGGRAAREAPGSLLCQRWEENGK
jgi:hypothetical protein